MKQYPPDKIRNIGVIGSGAVGKTSLCEALLFTAGDLNKRRGKILTIETDRVSALVPQGRSPSIRPLNRTTWNTRKRRYSLINF